MSTPSKIPASPPGESVPAETNFVRLERKLAYGTGGMVDLLAVWVVVQVAYPVFQMGLGLAPVVVGSALLAFRFWDALSDPIMGWVTDRFPTRWGRRKPYMVGGAIACGLLYPVMWHFPPHAGTPALMAWFIGFGMLFYSAFTMWNIPYQSMLFEMSPDYHERTRIASIRNAFITASMVISGWIWWTISSPLLSTSPWIELAGTAELSRTATGMRNFSLILGPAFTLMGFIPILFVRERRETVEEKADRAKPENRHTLFAELGLTLRNRQFLALAGMTLLLLLGPQMVSNFGIYVLRYYVADGVEEVASRFAGLGGTVYIVLNLAAIPLFVRLSRKIGKRGVVRIGLILLGSASLVTLLTFVPGHPEFTLLGQLLAAPGQAAIWSILPSMTADIVDEDELATHRRREGSFASIFSLLVKIGISMAVFLQGPMLELSGFDQALGANQPDTVFWNLRLMLALVPATVMLGALFLLSRYRITEDSANATRRTLEARRGSLQPVDTA